MDRAQTMAQRGVQPENDLLIVLRML